MDPRASVEAVWRVESARIVSTLARMVGDFEQAEDLAQVALAEALESWPATGVPENPGAWLTAVAKRRAVDGWRRRERQDAGYARLAGSLEQSAEHEWEPIPDDVLRLVFVACHPVLGRDAQIALTLRVVGGLGSEEIARAFFVPVPTMQARITRAKKTLSAARVPFEVPEPHEWAERLAGVLAVLYSVFTEGYAATSGETWMRPDLAREALRLTRVLARLVPREPEVHGLLALMELQSSRFAARTAPDGSPVLLPDQDRRRWDRSAITRGREALRRVTSSAAGAAPTRCRLRSRRCTPPHARTTRPTGPASCSCTTPSPASHRARSSTSTGPWRSRWPTGRDRRCRWSSGSSPTAPWPAPTCPGACAPSCWPGWIGTRRRPRSSPRPRS